MAWQWNTSDVQHTVKNIKVNESINDVDCEKNTRILDGYNNFKTNSHPKLKPSHVKNPHNGDTRMVHLPETGVNTDTDTNYGCDDTANDELVPNDLNTTKNQSIKTKTNAKHSTLSKKRKRSNPTIIEENIVDIDNTENTPRRRRPTNKKSQTDIVELLSLNEMENAVYEEYESSCDEYENNAIQMLKMRGLSKTTICLTCSFEIKNYNRDDIDYSSGFSNSSNKSQSEEDIENNDQLDYASNSSIKDLSYVNNVCKCEFPRPRTISVDGKRIKKNCFLCSYDKNSHKTKLSLPGLNNLFDFMDANIATMDWDLLCRCLHINYKKYVEQSDYNTLEKNRQITGVDENTSQKKSKFCTMTSKDFKYHLENHTINPYISNIKDIRSLQSLKKLQEDRLFVKQQDGLCKIDEKGYKVYVDIIQHQNKLYDRDPGKSVFMSKSTNIDHNAARTGINFMKTWTQ